MITIQENRIRQRVKIKPELITNNVNKNVRKHPTNTNNVNEDITKRPINTNHMNNEVVKRPTNTKHVYKDVIGYPMFPNRTRGISGSPTRKRYTKL